MQSFTTILSFISIIKQSNLFKIRVNLSAIDQIQFLFRVQSIIFHTFFHLYHIQTCSIFRSFVQGNQNDNVSKQMLFLPCPCRETLSFSYNNKKFKQWVQMYCQQFNKVAVSSMTPCWFIVPLYFNMENSENLLIQNSIPQIEMKMISNTEVQNVQREENTIKNIESGPHDAINQSEKFHNQNFRRKSEQKQQEKKQKRGRNIFSNIFRSFLKYLTSKQFLDVDYHYFKENIRKQQFSQRLKQETKRFKNYVKKQQIFSFLRSKIAQNPQQQYNNIIKSSLLFYLQNKHRQTIIKSKKISQAFRKLHMKELKKFERMIKKILKQKQATYTE